jgi:type II secretory pathway pseudopilin PulG
MGRATPTGSRPVTREPWTADHAARGGECGFTLAAVVVIMALMAIFLTIAVETASFQQRREKEEELIFRGNQVVEAIRIFRARNGRFPINLNELVVAKPRVLRKKWPDPMTGVPDWEPVFLGEEGTTVAGGGVGPAATPTPGPVKGPKPGPGTKTGAIIGVHSRSCDEAIKLYDGRTRYCEWKFYFDPNKQAGPRPPGPVPTPPR